jgi:hypothetical protein
LQLIDEQEHRVIQNFKDNYDLSINKLIKDKERLKVHEPEDNNKVADKPKRN